MRHLTEHDIFSCKEKRGVLPFVLFLTIVTLLVSGAVYFFFGTGSDYRRIQLKLFIDGSAQNHMFSKGSSIAGLDFQNINLRGSCFPSVNLEKTDFSGADLQNALFKNCSMKGVDLKNAKLKGAMFVNCTLTNANLQFADLTDCSFQESTLHSALLGNAQLENCDLENADLRGVAGLSTSELRKAAHWHKALFDPETAKTIKLDFAKNGIPLPGYQSWEHWLLKQKEQTLSTNP